MIIRAYRPEDEQQWLQCRVLSFMDTAYATDVLTQKETYPHPSLSLVAEDNGQIVGLIDLELDCNDLTLAQSGAMIWHMAVLPEYRRQGTGRRLWEKARTELIRRGVRWCELWTQEDQAANRFYQAMGFRLQEEYTWLRCTASAKGVEEWIQHNRMGNIFGVEELRFAARKEQWADLEPLCKRIDEVRLYACEVKPQAVRVEMNTPLWTQLTDYARRSNWIAGPHLADMLQGNRFTDWEAPFALMAGEEIIGYGTFMKTDFYPENRYSPWISSLYVEAGCRGRLWSGVLIRTMEDYARSCGFDRAYIPCEREGLYERFGYAAIDRLMNYGGDEDLIYVREL